MALHLKVSNSLEQLARSFCRDLIGQDVPVFQPHYIVTQTEGMNNWLKLQLAEKLGIAANYRFVSPNEIIYKVYQLLGGEYLQPLSAENQCWLLFKLLAAKEFTDRFKDIAEYYEEGSDKEVKRLALAEKVADLFDQYQVYRPEMIRKWNDDPSVEVPGGEWQKYLWRQAKQLVGEKMPDKTFVGEFIVQALKEKRQQDKLCLSLPAVHLFGLSLTTAYHIQILHLIGLYTEVYFHILNPAPEVYWFDDRSEKQLAWLKRKGLADQVPGSAGNALLTSWGKVIQNTFGLFFQYDDFMNAYEEVHPEMPQPDTLLHKIQQDVFNNSSDEERNVLQDLDLADGSIQINSCFTPAREVEVLYNYLVHLVDQRKEALSPREIVVMVTDIDTYAPYIKAVFEHAPFKIPFRIADESYIGEDSISAALKSILSINRQNFHAENVLQLLDSRYIRERFGLTDVDMLRKAVDAANIRFGLEGEKADDSIYVSWRYGLQRIMYGICMIGSEEYMIEGAESLFPLDIVEGASSLELIRFCHFAEVLMQTIEDRDSARSIPDWVQYVERVLHDLVHDPAEDEDEDYPVLLKQLEEYNSLSDLMGEAVSFDVFTHSFLNTIGGASRTGSFATYGITFCSLIPMRSIPFKVVALLGMNFDKFPRKEIASSFNLMERDKRKGDRNVKENDKHLFLETLLSAQDYLYISYVGRSVKDNTALPPSALVDELIDYIESGYEGENNVRDAIVCLHPLHGFSRRYSSNGTGLYTYLNHSDFTAESVEVRASEKHPEPFDFSEVSLDSLVSFFKNPFKGYYNKVLKIHYRDDEVLLSDTEMFELDGLQKWSLKQELLVLRPEDVGQLRGKLVKTGGLPLKNMSEVVLDQVDEEVESVRSLLQEIVGGLQEETINLEIDFEDNGTKVTGALKVYGDNLVMVCWSSDSCKYMLEAYIQYLAVRASGMNVRLFFIQGKKLEVYKGVAMNVGEAKERLKRLLGLYKLGHERLLPFFPGFGFKPKDIEELTEENFRGKVHKKLNDEHTRCDDPYVQNKNREGFLRDEQAFELYLRCAENLLLPLAEVFPDGWR